MLKHYIKLKKIRLSDMKNFNTFIKTAILAAICSFGLALPQEAQARSGQECPDPVVMPVCSWQSDINRAFARWKSDFDYDDCEVAPDLDDIKAPKKCTGGVVRVTLYDCDNPSDDCYSTFTVVPPPPPAADCPIDMTIGPCVTQGEVEQAFTNWLRLFKAVDNCDVNDDIGGFEGTPTAPNHCGGSTTVTFTVRNKIDCYPPVSCTRTFTVLETQPPVLNCPMNANLPACLTQAAVNSQYQAWLDMFQVDAAQSCPGTQGRFDFIPPAPGKCGGSVTVTYRATTPNGCASNFCTRTFTVAPDNIPPMGTCPPSVTGLTCLSEIPEPDANAIAANYTDNCGIVIGQLADLILSENDCDFTVTHEYWISDDCGNFVPCIITYSGGDHEAPTGVCPAGEVVDYLNEVPAPDPELIRANYTDNCGHVTVTVLNVTQTGSVCDGLTITHNYAVRDDCGKDNTTLCSVSYTVPGTGETGVTGTCPAPVTGLQCWADVPSAAEAELIMQAAFPGATVVYVTTTTINNYCQFTIRHMFSITDPCTGARTNCVLSYSGQDQTPPFPTNGGCPAGTVSSTIPPPDPAGVAAGYTDNCSSVHAYRIGTTMNGNSVTYHYRVYDDCDNSVSCSVTHTNTSVLPGNGPANLSVAPNPLNLTAYPNPTNGELFLDFEKAAGEEAVLTIRNLFGQEVLTRNLILDAPTQRLNLSSEGLSNGTYLLTVRTQDAYTTPDRKSVV